MNISARHQLILNIANALNHPLRLKMLDALQAGPMRVTELAKMCQVDDRETEEHLAVLKQAGLLLGETDSDQPLSLSPFGMYGAGKIMEELLVVTHEDGQCGCCKGCSEKK